MRLILLLLVIYVIYRVIKNNSSEQKTSKSFDSQMQNLKLQKEEAIEAARKRYEEKKAGNGTPLYLVDEPMYVHMARFFNAVNLIREPNGRGNVILRMNEDGSTFSISARYCNYSCVSCMEKLLYDGALDYPGMTVSGGDLDAIQYDIPAVKNEYNDFSIGYLSKEIREKVPGTVINLIAERGDFVSLEFQTV